MAHQDAQPPVDAETSRVRAGVELSRCTQRAGRDDRQWQGEQVAGSLGRWVAGSLGRYEVRDGDEVEIGLG